MDKIKLVALDLDGTFFDSQKNISSKNLAAVKKAIENGVIIMPATGRPFIGIPEEIRAIKEIKYVITVNGAAIYDMHSGECVFEDPIRHETMLSLIDDLDRLRIMSDLFIGGQGYMDSKNKNFLQSSGIDPAVMKYILSSRLVVDSLPELIRTKKPAVQKITINFTKLPDGSYIDREKTIEAAKKYSDLIYVSGGMGNVELTNKTVSKGNAMLSLAEKLGIKQSETMAIGDSGNDLDMIKKAGVGVAMANSEKYVLDNADFVTLSNDDDGVAYALEKFLY